MNTSQPWLSHVGANRLALSHSQQARISLTSPDVRRIYQVGPSYTFTDFVYACDDCRTPAQLERDIIQALCEQKNVTHNTITSVDIYVNRVNPHVIEMPNGKTPAPYIILAKGQPQNRPGLRNYTNRTNALLDAMKVTRRMEFSAIISNNGFVPHGQDIPLQRATYACRTLAIEWIKRNAVERVFDRVIFSTMDGIERQYGTELVNVDATIK